MRKEKCLEAQDLLSQLICMDAGQMKVFEARGKLLRRVKDILNQHGKDSTPEKSDETNLKYLADISIYELGNPVVWKKVERIMDYWTMVKTSILESIEKETDCSEFVNQLSKEYGCEFDKFLARIGSTKYGNAKKWDDYDKSFNPKVFEVSMPKEIVEEFSWCIYHDNTIGGYGINRANITKVLNALKGKVTRNFQKHGRCIITITHHVNDDTPIVRMNDCLYRVVERKSDQAPEMGLLPKNWYNVITDAKLFSKVPVWKLERIPLYLTPNVSPALRVEL